ncbi:MAG: ATP-binding cassette domain-containing protein, partial [Candidatus Heimdallarchaeota archaeon]|nr:ATP-binding cassette domain-containing protein [Candidatus Heimdallarchaeota archaeon]
ETREGRILGVAGVQGNGQTELLDVIMNLRKIDSGSIILVDTQGNDMNLENKSTLDILKGGIGYIPEDRTSQGLIGSFLIKDNIWLAFYDLPENAVNYVQSSDEDAEAPSTSIFNRSVLLPFTLIKKVAKSVISGFDVRASSIEQRISELSGGNQQKVLLGREFAKNPRLIVASQPTRGVDIGVMNMVHEDLIRRRNAGVSILLVSSDLDEILKLSDDIIIMYEGKIAAIGKLEEFSVNEISQLMTSGKVEKSESKSVESI